MMYGSSAKVVITYKTQGGHYTQERLVGTTEEEAKESAGIYWDHVKKACEERHKNFPGIKVEYPTFVSLERLIPVDWKP